ncbi:MAG: hypothetical protein FJ096_18330 [Deltaproteobacteria bacterium]|nr:hypothetical protein [Deltaproteobacteria bacterium]
MRILVATIVSTLALVACGGGDETNSSAAATTTSASSGSGGAGGAGGGVASSTGTGAVGQNVLFPLAIGKEWTFKVTKVGSGGICGEGTFTSKVTDSKDLAGKTAYSVTSWCSSVSDAGTYAAGTGDELFYYFNKEWQVILDGKLEDGNTWKFQGLEYRWKELGVQTIDNVMLGDCWGASRVDSPLVYDVYCRGVGAIRHHNEVDGNGYDAVLVLNP